MIKPYSPKVTVVACCLCLHATICLPKPSFKKPGRLFMHNKRAESRTLFTEAAKQNQSAGEALLGLSLLVAVR